MTACMQSALRIARRLGVVPTFPTLRVIEAAVEAEADFLAVSIDEAEELIVLGSRDLHFRGTPKQQSLNRFFFEDALWRDSYVYRNFLAGRRLNPMEEIVALEKAEAEGAA
jgi:hypothetical protein